MKQFLLLLCWTLLRANEEKFIPIHLFSTIEGPLCMTIRFDEDGSESEGLLSLPHNCRNAAAG